MAERRTTQQSAARLREVVDQILDEVHQMPAELVTWKPAPEVWSVLENLCHIDEFVPFWTGQVLNVIRDPGSEWGRTHTDTQRIAAVNAASTRDLADVERSIRAGAADAAAKLAALGDADLAIEAKSRNPKWGVKPAGFIVDELVVGHVEKHLGQIRRNVTQYQAR